MKIQKKWKRAYAAKASALKRLLGGGMLLEGSLNMSMRGGSEHWQLTDKVDGKSHRPGVPPTAEPDVEEAVAEYAEFIRKAWGALGPLFKDVYAGHDESLCLYTDDTVVCTFLAVTMLKCRSRNAVDGCRNSAGMAGLRVPRPAAASSWAGTVRVRMSR